MRKPSARRDHLLPMSLDSVIIAYSGFAVVLWLVRESDHRTVLRTVAGRGRRGTGHSRSDPRHHYRSLRSRLVVAVVECCRGAARRCLGASHGEEAINLRLPVGAVGGDIVRARLLNFSGVAGGATVASGSVDLLLQMAAQALFALIGFGIPPE